MFSGLLLRQLEEDSDRIEYNWRNECVLIENIPHKSEAGDCFHFCCLFSLMYWKDGMSEL